MDKYLTKKSGEPELFDEEKVRKSFLNAGADEKIANLTVGSIKENIKNFNKTDDIYRHAVKQFKKHQPAVALKYTLKRAMMDLGPTGFIFERYMAKILKEYGFKTEVDRFVKGFCVEHEIDIIAEKDGDHFMIECKYHNNSDIKSDIKTVLYINSRFQDIQKACEAKLNGYRLKQGGLATNTKITSEAVRYARCVNLFIIAWHYPEKKNLEYYIEDKKLYPVSILAGLNNQQKNILFDNNIITIQDLLTNNPNNLSKLLNTDLFKIHKFLGDAKLLNDYN